jgi:hypothetical protein
MVKQPMARQPWTRKVNNVRVIRDIRNSGMDYYIPEVRAKQLFDEGKLIQVQAYNNRWCYATRESHEYYD